MGRVTRNVEGFVGETGAVDVMEEGEGDTDDPISYHHDVLEGLSAGRVVGTIPHSDAAALNGASR